MTTRRGLPIALLFMLLPASVATAQTGAFLSISTEPADAMVRLDGTDVGRTPLVSLPVAPGRHHLQVKPEGAAAFLVDRDLDLEAGQSLKLVLPEPPIAAVIPPTVTASPIPPPARVSHPWLDVPWPTWIAGGVAAGLFGVGLGFGIEAGNIDHMAGVDVSTSGVDLGLTRATALAGQRDATIGNALMISAGVVTVVGLVFAVLAPDAHALDAKPEAGAAK